MGFIMFCSLLIYIMLLSSKKVEKSKMGKWKLPSILLILSLCHGLESENTHTYFAIVFTKGKAFVEE